MPSVQPRHQVEVALRSKGMLRLVSTLGRTSSLCASLSRFSHVFSHLAGGAAFASIALLAGCGGGLQLTAIKSARQRPSNVAFYFKVEAGHDEPVGGLSADSFRIFEDGDLVSPFESKQVILNPEVAAAHYTLLLVDMSGSVSESGSGTTVVDATTAFVERVESSQKVAVYAFDGSSDLHPVAPFASGGSAKAGLRTLATYRANDPSTNLNGAVLKGLAELRRALGQDPAPLKFGTLVVFTDGTDRAARVTRSDMRRAVKDSPYEVFAIGLGAELKESTLSDIGKDGTALAVNRETVVKAFDTVAAKVEARTKSYYLLSYCSPARAGKHKVTVEAVYKPKSAAGEGSERTGKTEAEFDASGFGPGCDPRTPPAFDVSKGDALAPKPDERRKDKEREKDDDKPKKPKAAPSGGGASQLPPPPPPAPAPPPPNHPAAEKQEFNP